MCSFRDGAGRRWFSADGDPELPSGRRICAGECNDVGEGGSRSGLRFGVWDHSSNGEVDASDKVGDGGASANSITPRKYDSSRLFFAGGSRSFLSIKSISRSLKPCDIADERWFAMIIVGGLLLTSDRVYYSRFVVVVAPVIGGSFF